MTYEYLTQSEQETRVTSQQKLNELQNKLNKIEERHSKYAQILAILWVSGDYDQKVQLQDLLFPGGILFDKQKENYRTEKINSVLELTRSFTQTLKGNKKGQTNKSALQTTACGKRL